MIGKVPGGNKKTSEDHPNYRIIMMGQNTEKSTGDLWKISVTQTPVENHQPAMAGKALKVVK